MVGFALLSRILPNLHDRSGDFSNPEQHYDTPSISIEQRIAVTQVVLGLPLVCVCLQLFLWRRFSLRDRYLATVKQAISQSIDLSAV